MNPATPPTRGPDFYARAERRTALLILAIGGLAALVTLFTHSANVALGVAIGTALAWINYRWLADAASAIARVAIASAQTDSAAPRPRIPVSVYLKVLARYTLIGLVLYVIFTRLPIPLVSVLAGLCSLGAAVMGHGLYEVFFLRKR